MEAKDWNAQETLFAFMGWLTSRSPRVAFSASDDAAPAVDLIKAFSERHELPAVRDGWETGIVSEK